MINGVIVMKKIKENILKSKILNKPKNISKIKRKIRKPNIFSKLLLNLFILINLFLSTTSKIKEKYKKISINSFNEIKIKIIGFGTQKILKTNFNETLPSQVLVNGEASLIEPGNTISNLQKEENLIIMKWDNKIANGAEMFSNLNNLIEVDFSNFDGSELTTMNYIFNECKNLISVNFTNFKTPKLSNIGGMFYECSSLLSLDLSSLDTSLVTNMGSMFYECTSLKSINFGNIFNTFKVKSLAYFFYNCSSLESIDLSNFDISSVTKIDYMFSKCTSLISLDLSNFRANSLEYILAMFEGCINLKYIDISNLNASTISEIYDLFRDCKNLEYIKLYNFIEARDLIIEDMLEGVPDNLTYCTNNEANIPIIIGELNKKNCTINDCSDLWNTKTKKIIEEKNICVYDCSTDEMYKYEYKNKCYKNCPNGTFLSNNKKNCLIECPENLPFEKNEECVADCNVEDFFHKVCRINNKNIQSKEKMVYNIENSNLFFEDILNKGENDLILKDINETYQITTSKNQNNKEYYNNETIIILGECESILKEIYNINNDEALIIYKMDYFLNDLLIPITEYEIFNPETKEKLDLNKCSNSKISIYIPVIIDENYLYKYDPFSEYYKDKCYPYISECGDEDNILLERKNEFNNNFLSLCERNCIYQEYDSYNKKVKCKVYDKS